VKKHRRIEITAFRRRTLTISGGSASETDEIDVQINNADSSDTLDTGSAEGRDILLEAIRLLEQRVPNPPQLADKSTDKEW
jgi:hypothetical protein